VEGIVFQQFDGCGHYPHDERPEQFVRVVREFIDDATVSPARLRKMDTIVQDRATARRELLTAAWVP
jgi:hypothetical protein